VKIQSNYVLLEEKCTICLEYARLVLVV